MSEPRYVEMFGVLVEVHEPTGPVIDLGNGLLIEATEAVELIRDLTETDDETDR